MPLIRIRTRNLVNILSPEPVTYATKTDETKLFTGEGAPLHHAHLISRRSHRPKQDIAVETWGLTLGGRCCFSVLALHWPCTSLDLRELREYLTMVENGSGAVPGVVSWKHSVFGTAVGGETDDDHGGSPMAKAWPSGEINPPSSNPMGMMMEAWPSRTGDICSGLA
ncbi:hypothetical protein VNO77_03345 [Canavalia gladiata]|uniref:Uncharacterized protein n=1 Tax=Canavalia gladiata TaxID=3824 RepID=A0AAN9R3S8_CANGL